MLDTRARKVVQPLFDQAATGLKKLGLSANQVTIISGIIGAATGFFVYNDMMGIAILLLWISGMLDVVDGTMARREKTTPIGTILDLVLDRVVELSVLIGLALRFPETQIVMLFLIASFVIGMTMFLAIGAVSENYGFKSFQYQPGLIERTEGFLFLTAMLLFPGAIIWIALVFLIAELYTVGERFYQASKVLR
ncbi:CDP-alcohol phosphatidyltransferase family protein [Exiguobacterium sp. s193]|uniref:CDP-alcohol phosphatidyltransferase family protein n=1 Tax=Exiguobacterium sp. s193 TaxID=2751207 RepID=UPI001BEC45FD|nr:CDP-alcohol phosphatidyltransferase family protein [Exiguobacterium sp. s193]